MHFAFVLIVTCVSNLVSLSDFTQVLVDLFVRVNLLYDDHQATNRLFGKHEQLQRAYSASSAGEKLEAVLSIDVSICDASLAVADISQHCRNALGTIRSSGLLRRRRSLVRELWQRRRYSFQQRASRSSPFHLRGHILRCRHHSAVSRATMETRSRQSWFARWGTA